MRVYLSRLGNLENGEDVCFIKGETVKYKLKSGEIVDIIITDGPFGHEEVKGLVWEADFPDDGKNYCAEARRIIDWEGRNTFKS